MLTSVNISPVIIGTMNPPKKSKSQINIAKIWKSFTNGAGMLTNTAKLATIKQIFKAFGLEYPPCE